MTSSPLSSLVGIALICMEGLPPAASVTWVERCKALRPNGPGDSSPGLRPEANALGGGTMKTLRPESTGRGDAVLASSNKNILLLRRSREPSILHVAEPGSRGLSGRNNGAPPFPGHRPPA